MDLWLFLALCFGVLIAGMFIGAGVSSTNFEQHFQCTESAVVGRAAECIKYEKVKK